jgi:protein AFG1
MLMDLVYNMIPEERLKQRVHFNKFMLKSVHQGIHKIKTDSAHKYDDPLSVLCDQLVRQTHLLFFDEFQVTDIADAMLMSRLFTSLFERGMVVFFTSNREPIELYKNGLQRELFLPFVDVIHHYCDVINLNSPVDYRKRAHISASNRIYFNSDYEHHLLKRQVRNLIKKEDVDLQASVNVNDELSKLHAREIDILGRRVYLEKTYKRLLYTSFAFMCEEARSSVDYLEFCKLFDVIILRDIPFINIKHFDVLRRFITFIDTVYDNRIKLLCSGKASSPSLLFDLSKSNINKMHDEHFALERTISRLIDMQSENYINNTVRENIQSK